VCVCCNAAGGGLASMVLGGVGLVGVGRVKGAAAGGSPVRNGQIQKILFDEKRGFIKKRIENKTKLNAKYVCETTRHQVVLQL